MFQNSTLTHKGFCYCKKIQFETKGDPLFTQYCHCNKCRKIASQSSRKQDQKGYSHTAAYFKKDFRIIEGADYLEKHGINNAFLYLCKSCKSLIYGISQDKDQQEGIGINVSNFSFNESRIPDSFKPIRHAYYADRIIEINDKLPKFVDFPLELGGSGKKVSL